MSYSIGQLERVIFSLDLPTVSAFLQAAYPIFCVLGMWLFAFLAGRTFQSFWRSLRLGVGERFLMATGLGWGILIFLFLLLGACGMLYRTYFIALFTAGDIGLLLWHRDLFSRKMEAKPPPQLKDTKSSGWRVVFGWIIALFVIVFLLESLAPEIYYDSLVYHLGIPKLWLLHHRLIPTPSLIYSGIPLN